MTYSSLTNQVRLSPNQWSSRNGRAIDTFLIHHQAGTNDDATINAMVSGSKEVSANYTISNEGRLTLVVDEDNRAWTSSSAEWDGRSVTVEIENESGDPDWRISEAALNKAAELLNDLRKRYRITNVLGHRDLYARFGVSYPTYCPGPNTVAEITRRADATLTQEVPDMDTRQNMLLESLYQELLPGKGGVKTAGTQALALGEAVAKVTSLIASVAALTKAVEVLAVGQGADPVVIRAAAMAGATEALKDLKLNGSVVLGAN